MFSHFGGGLMSYHIASTKHCHRLVQEVAKLEGSWFMPLFFFTVPQVVVLFVTRSPKNYATHSS